MGGALIQLAAIGQEDMFLTGEPQITYFKSVYRRHTNFTKEQIPQYFSNTPNFGKTVHCTIAKNGDLMGNIVLSVILPQILLPTSGRAQFAWVKRIGFALIKSITIVINGYQIDKHYGDWLNIWAELTGDISGNKSSGFKQMIGDVPSMFNFSYSKQQYQLFIPFQFWFCRSSGTVLPLSSLQFSDVRIDVEFENDINCYMISPTHYITCMDDIANFTQYEYIEQNINGDLRAGLFMDYDINTKRLYYYKITTNKLISIPINTSFDVNNQTSVSSLLSSNYGLQYLITGKTSNYTIFAQLTASSISVSTSQISNLNFIDCFLIIDYYYLDDEERIKFMRSRHDYLIEQLFYTPPIQITDVSSKQKITSYNPCKFTVWTVQYQYINNSLDYYNYTNTYQNKAFNSEKYTVNLYTPIGNNIIQYCTILNNGNERLSFRDSEYFEYIQQFQNNKFSPQTGMNTYSYALYPYLTDQPSGSFNTSQIEDIDIKMQFENKVNINFPVLFKAYSICHNVLRIVDGLAGLVFTQ
ncbi:capsid protein [Bodo saltans virus]|uniref:Capsid protein n=1 Tax=Bodo saltans virus TaxID=2024608 RepID=A0A2H4UUF1_9VIRU|nr:capsid protein [Bodo saltans virus]ATZ80552.1 capsid protein [Bodo saltans virus]